MEATKIRRSCSGFFNHIFNSVDDEGETPNLQRRHSHMTILVCNLVAFPRLHAKRERVSMKQRSCVSSWQALYSLLVELKRAWVALDEFRSGDCENINISDVFFRWTFCESGAWSHVVVLLSLLMVFLTLRL